MDCGMRVIKPIINFTEKKKVFILIIFLFLFFSFADSYTYANDVLCVETTETDTIIIH